MKSPINTYILFSNFETDRQHTVNLLKDCFENYTIIPSIYPTKIHVPYLQELVKKSQSRTGKALSLSEIGCLLGHRKIWQEIIKQDSDEATHFLILESDSKINDITELNNHFSNYTQPYDIFFWGAWEGNARIKRSTILFEKNNRIVGEPLIKSIYCTYGYSINIRAARYLLSKTRKISYPVDMFKHFINPNELKIGAIRKELISTWRNLKSYIRTNNLLSTIKRFCIVTLFDCRNCIQAYFS
jgi:GR25 family glycosyltransferase involved in LPS biosynthesis